VTRAALVHPEIGWLLVSDDETLLDLRPGTAAERVSAILGERVGQAADAGGGADGVSVDRRIPGSSGIRPALAHRAVPDAEPPADPDKMIAHAIFQDTSISDQRRISAVRHQPDDRPGARRCECPPFETRSEVRAGRDDLSDRVVRDPEDPDAHDLVRAWSSGTAMPSTGRTVPSGARYPAGSGVRVPEGPIGGIRAAARWRFDPADVDASSPASSPETVEHRSAISRSADADARAIWQIQNKYIVSQVRSGLVIVDQHVAHERILYERVWRTSRTACRPCSSSVPANPGTDGHRLCVSAGAGRTAAPAGVRPQAVRKNTVVIEGIPADVKVGNEKKILLDVLEEYKANEHAEVMDARDRLAKSFACKAAIKAGDPLTSNEMTVLIEQCS